VNTPSGLTERLCGLIRDTTYDTLGAECIARVKQAITDGVCVALAGSGDTPVRLATEHLLALGGNPQATVWGGTQKVSVVQAAFVNALATHVQDFEPMWSPPTHSVSPTVPVAFALAELLPVDGRQLITAVARGLEVQGRLQYAGNQYVPEALKFHPPGYAGVIGSAVVAATLLDLGPQALRNAIGLSASRAGALLANVGSMAKATHCGNAAASGLDAALLASRGFTANPDVLEAHKGFISSFYPEHFDEQRLLDWGRPFRVVDPGLAIKLFPSQYGTHYGITAGLELHRSLNGRRDIRAVQTRTPVMKYVDRPKPATGLDGKFSLQYTTAAALLDGAVRIASFTDERRFRPDMVALLDRFELRQDAAIPGDFHRMFVEVEVELEEGQRLRSVCNAPRGSWGSPMAPGEHQAKLDDCLSHALTAAAASRLLAQLDRLETLSAVETAALPALMSAQ
jgi:2-methylcitrate dehydratase PrpD